MKGFILSFRSEFYKTRKTIGFWGSIILPVLLCVLLFLVFLKNADHFAKAPGILLWMQFAGAILGVMGSLLLPMLIIFIAYSVNSIEHKADTWKTIFSLPISKLSVYGAKYLYAVFLVFLCLALFVLLTISFGNLLSVLNPEYKFNEYNFAGVLLQLYFKLFLSTLGILSVQFLLSLLFSDFLKPMGIGFFFTIVGIIIANIWQYAYLFPYSHPMLALKAMHLGNGPEKKAATTALPNLSVDLFTKDTYVSLAIAVIVFVGGYFIVLKKSVK